MNAQPNTSIRSASCHLLPRRIAVTLVCISLLPSPCLAVDIFQEGLLSDSGWSEPIDLFDSASGELQQVDLSGEFSFDVRFGMEFAEDIPQDFPVNVTQDVTITTPAGGITVELSGTAAAKNVIGGQQEDLVASLFGEFEQTSPNSSLWEGTGTFPLGVSWGPIKATWFVPVTAEFVYVFGSTSSRLGYTYTFEPSDPIDECDGEGFSWVSAGGGVFSDSDNWSGCTVPGPEDGVSFDLENTTYTVNFNQSRETSASTHEAGQVVYQLNDHTYSLNNDNLGLLVAPNALNQASLTLKNGTVDVSGNVQIATDLNSSGALNVEGASLFVGDPDDPSGTSTLTLGSASTSTGELVVSDGGKVWTNRAMLGDEPDSQANLEVSGTVSAFHVTSLEDDEPAFVVGQEGQATVTVKNMAGITARATVLGAEAGATGTLSITDASSFDLESPGETGLVVGLEGSGHLSVMNGATASVQPGIEVALRDDSQGEITVSHATLAAPLMDIGIDGEGLLTADDGAQLSIQELRIGVDEDDVGGSGKLVLSGVHQMTGETGEVILTPTQLIDGFFIDVGGGDGKGELRLEDGAIMQIDQSGGVGLGDASKGFPLIIEPAGTAEGTVIIGSSTSNPSVLSAGFLAIANRLTDSRGQFEVHQGGEATFTLGMVGRDKALADESANEDASARILVSGGTLRFTLGTGDPVQDVQQEHALYVGGQGEVRVENGGLIESEAVVIGSTSGFQARATVSGVKSVNGVTTPSRWNAAAMFVSLGPEALLSVDNGAQINATQIFVGGQGTVNIVAGGTINSEKGFVGSNVLGNPTVDAQATISGQGSTWTLDGQLVVGSESGDPAVKGTVYLNDQGLLVADEVVVKSGGLVTGSGGTLQANTTKIENGGQIAPGLSPGTLSIFGALEILPGGELEIEIGGDTANLDHDVLVVNGETNIEGQVTLRFIDGFAPQQGDEFEFLITEEDANLANAEFVVENLATGFEFQIGSSPQGILMTALTDGIYRLLGDFNANGMLDAADIDLLSEEIRRGSHQPEFDLNGDQLVDSSDRFVWVKDSKLKFTYFGDVNLDGQFNTSDLVAIFQAGEYEDDVAMNSSWATGDWNGDTEFGTADLVLAFQDGGFEQGPRGAAAAVPEPSGMLLGLLVFSAFVSVSRRSACKRA